MNLKALENNKTFCFLKKTIVSIIENDYSGMAAEMSYMLVIGIFPFLLFLVSWFNMIGKNYYINPVFLFLQKFMPAESIHMIESVLDQVLGFTSGKSVAIFSLLITLFMSMNALSVVIKGINRAYKVAETRAFIYTRFLSLIMVIVNTLILFFAYSFIIFGRVITRFLMTYATLPSNTAEFFMTIRWPVAFFTLFLMAFLHYYVFPDVTWSRELKCKSAIPGALFFCVIWLIASWGFSVYVNTLHTYNFVYGSIAAFAMLMVWFYFTSMLLLIGGEINSQIHDKLEKDKIIEALEIQQQLNLERKEENS